MKDKLLTPSKRPCDVAYRIQRMKQCLEDAMAFAGGIDPSIEGHAGVVAVIEAAQVAAGAVQVPAKRGPKAAAPEDKPPVE